MQKKAKILIIVLAIVAVAVPSAYFGINALIDKEVDSVEITLDGFTLDDMDADSMNLTVDFSIDSNVDVAVNFHIDNAKLTYMGTEIGTIIISENSFTSTSATYADKEIQVTITNNAQFVSFLTEYINDYWVPLSLKGDVVFDNPPIPLDNYGIDKSFTIDGLNGLPGMVSADVNMISISITPGIPTTGSVDINTTISISNPTDYTFKIVDFAGDLKFDDDDGYSVPPFINYAQENGITLDELDLDWSSAPVELIPSGSCEKNQTLQSSQVNEATIRVYDEYINDNDLECYITDGEATIELFGNEITVSGITVAKFAVENTAD